MFRSFFMNRKWLYWAYLGSALILVVTWYKVQLDVDINKWFGDFYNLIQKALQTPGSVTIDEYFAEMLTVFWILAKWVTIAVILEFFISHYVFRWRTAMNNFYLFHWQAVRHIEGAAQRVQEDTMRFAKIMESLGVSFMRSVMTLFAFLPLLWGLSEQITEVPWIGEIDHSLVYIAIVYALGGTVAMAFIGKRLPGLEFDIQKLEAAFRKELVFGEDDEARADPPTVSELFHAVRGGYFRLYFHYFYFNVFRWSYLQYGALIPYVAVGPSIIVGAVTLGVVQQIIRAFGKVESSFQFLVYSWPTIVELISIYKRLQAFESQIKIKEGLGPDDVLPSQPKPACRRPRAWTGTPVRSSPGRGRHRRRSAAGLPWCSWRSRARGS